MLPHKGTCRGERCGARPRANLDTSPSDLQGRSGPKNILGEAAPRVKVQNANCGARVTNHPQTIIQNATRAVVF